MLLCKPTHCNSKDAAASAAVDTNFQNRAEWQDSMSQGLSLAKHNAFVRNVIRETGDDSLQPDCELQKWFYSAGQSNEGIISLMFNALSVVGRA